MNKPRVILNHEAIEITIKRLAHELIETHEGFSDSAILGLQPRGTAFASMLRDTLCEILGTKSIPYGEFDATFYRDDFRRGEKPIIPSAINIDFDMEDKNIVLVDDVLYTGRSVRAALSALDAYGRPKSVELLVLIDRKYNRELPIFPNFFGKAVDTRGSNDKVEVEWKKNNNKVWIISDGK